MLPKTGTVEATVVFGRKGLEAAWVPNAGKGTRFVVLFVKGAFSYKVPGALWRLFVWPN